MFRAARQSALLVLVLATAACQTTAPAPAATPTAATRAKLVVGYVALNATHLPAWVAKERGIFDRNGLDVELQYIQSGSSPTAALLAGQMQVLVAAEQPLQASLQGADLLYVAAPTSTIFCALYTTPDIADAAGLKGKRIGITQVGSTTHTSARMALRSLSLDPDQDVTLLSTGSPIRALTWAPSAAIPSCLMKRAPCALSCQPARRPRSAPFSTLAIASAAPKRTMLDPRVEHSGRPGNSVINSTGRAFCATVAT